MVRERSYRKWFRQIVARGGYCGTTTGGGLRQTNQASSATGMPISDVPIKKSWKPVRSITKPEAPASKLPGSAQSEVISAYWLAANSVDTSEDM